MNAIKWTFVAQRMYIVRLEWALIYLCSCGSYRRIVKVIAFCAHRMAIPQAQPAIANALEAHSKMVWNYIDGMGCSRACFVGMNIAADQGTLKVAFIM
jgi:hypothetical protein